MTIEANIFRERNSFEAQIPGALHIHAGQVGPQGPQGPAGPAGKFEDLTEEQKESLRGPSGPQGETGPQGPQGIPGKTPEKGKDYLTDDDIKEIVEEVKKSYSGDIKTDSTLKFEDGILSVNTTDVMEKDNTLPITSAGVYTTVGNIEALLNTI